MSTNRTEKEQVRVHIRWMIRRDMPEVLQTEQESFEFAWTEEDFLRCLRQRNCIGMVAEQGEKVVGFMIYELHKAKLHILNFAVHPACRRSGVGAQMVAKLISKLSSHRRTRITLEVRETNLAAQLFFRTQELQGRPRAARLLRGQRRGRLPDAVPPRRRHRRGGRGDRQPHRPVRGAVTTPHISRGGRAGLDRRRGEGESLLSPSTQLLLLTLSFARW